MNEADTIKAALDAYDKAHDTWVDTVERHAVIEAVLRARVAGASKDELRALVRRLLADRKQLAAEA